MAMVHVEIVSAEKALFSGEAKMVILPGSQGELGIMPQHAPLLTSLKPGIITLIMEDNSEEFLYVAGGMLEVQPDKVTVLADVAERGENLDLERAEQARKAAEQALQSGVTGISYAAAQAELAQAAAQIELIRKIGKR